MFALRTFRGCLLADAVGSGKTFVALAAARLWNRNDSTCCLVPPGLSAQWHEVASRIGVAIATHSHSLLSRGRLPGAAHGLVVIDESHHFRNPATRRYRTVAPWLTGQRVLLLTATPFVNRPEDVLHQLALGVRDDALRTYGVPSMASALQADRPHQALGAVIVVSPGTGRGRPRTTGVVRTPKAGGSYASPAIQDAIARFRIDGNESIAALVRGLFWRACASSPAALQEMVRRYRLLLLQARDAGRQGRTLQRSMIRAWTGQLPEQLVMWQLMPEQEAGTGTEMMTQEDIAVAEELLALLHEPAADPKLEALRSVLGRPAPTLVFTGFQHTVAYLREALGPAVAWCTGAEAGIGRVRLPRHLVLEAFMAASPARRPVDLCITTDVAAEGFNLQRAARVVHYDLPWNEIRMEQRTGRAVRLGSSHSEVEVIQFRPPDSLEEVLAQLRTLERKRHAGRAIGLVGRGKDRWRWRSVVADRLGGSQPAEREPAVALVPGTPSGVLIGLRVLGRAPSGLAIRAAAGGTPILMASVVAWVDDDGTWTEEPEVVGPLLLEACHRDERQPVARHERNRVMAIAKQIEEVILLRWQERWTLPPGTPGLRTLILRARHAAVEAARRRDAATLQRLDATLRFLSGGHTAGERILIERLAAKRPESLGEATLPEATRHALPTEVRLTGAVVFGRR